MSGPVSKEDLHLYQPAGGVKGAGQFQYFCSTFLYVLLPTNVRILQKNIRQIYMQQGMCSNSTPTAVQKLPGFFNLPRGWGNTEDPGSR